MKKFAYSLMLCSALFATNYDDGLDAYKNKEYKKAINSFTQSVKNEQDMRSVRNLGIMHAYGTGVEKNIDKAITLLKQASTGGDAYAGLTLGNMYSQGTEVKKDFKEAALWFEKSSQAGDSKASYNLAYLYTYGDGVKKDSKKAYELYKKAATAGNIEAQINLTFIYISGQGVKKDMKQAAYWGKKVLDTGDERVIQLWEQFELEKYLEKK